jgi:hypothetical protein
MSLGIALFASVLLVLAVYHPKFRKVLFWFLGASAGVAVLIVAGVYFYKWYTDPWRVVSETPIQSNKLYNQSKAPDALPADFFTSGRQVLIQGGETLKILPPRPKDTRGQPQLDFSKSIPMIYGGHNQQFIIVCGNFGESGTNVAGDKDGTITCD